ncbi:DUF397 domain-containing protein [Endozoicomonas arenosclerae]|uniref:DUF397 domain-containing protein n=1 Tax=Endozoicomonas arenosclerae TaxID=1633495 RepID=UPI000783CB2B|nr:DUF397 domain-containing protein [Endozoicomonas arenosclerae]
MAQSDHVSVRSKWADAEFIRSSFTKWAISVEVACIGDEVAIRDDKDPDRGLLIFNSDEWSAFVKGVKNNEFDFFDK